MEIPLNKKITKIFYQSTKKTILSPKLLVHIKRKLSPNNSFVPGSFQCKNVSVRKYIYSQAQSTQLHSFLYTCIFKNTHYPHIFLLIEKIFF